MAVHAYHDGLPGYHPDQILHDGCNECEYRKADPVVALAHMDPETFRNAWIRARAFGSGYGTDVRGTISEAEAPLLRILYAVAIKLDQAQMWMSSV